VSARHPQEVPIAPRPKRKAPPAAVRSLVKAIEASLDADKAENIVRIPLAGKSSIADFMVIASGSNSRQLAAMADHIVEKLKERGRSHVPVEGRQQGDWVLVDAGDVIVHLFRPDARSHYALEKMWQAEFDEEAGAAAG
jgi:ribosome silencing factor RsfS/YbeB/iojap